MLQLFHVLVARGATAPGTGWLTILGHAVQPASTTVEINRDMLWLTITQP